MPYNGTIIEESLENPDIIKRLKIIKTDVEIVTPKHKTPWIKQWTLHRVEIPEEQARQVAEDLSKVIDISHINSWYADFRNDTKHYIIFRDKVFYIDRKDKSGYEEVRKYGLTLGIPEYQLPNYQDLPKDVLDAFLREANLHTYADEKAKQASPLRPGSKDYHFQKNNLVYHDTYFGGSKFMGEEIVYSGDKPAWGMNYYGFILDEAISEKLFDSILRPALMSGSGDNIPVRGPKEFTSGDWKYTFHIDGDLANFTGVEEVSNAGKIIYRLYCHGGFIE